VDIVFCHYRNAATSTFSFYLTSQVRENLPVKNLYEFLVIIITKVQIIVTLHKSYRCTLHIYIKRRKCAAWFALSARFFHA